MLDGPLAGLKVTFTLTVPLVLTRSLREAVPAFLTVLEAVATVLAPFLATAVSLPLPGALTETVTPLLRVAVPVTLAESDFAGVVSVFAVVLPGVGVGWAGGAGAAARGAGTSAGPQSGLVPPARTSGAVSGTPSSVQPPEKSGTGTMWMPSDSCQASWVP